MNLLLGRKVNKPKAVIYDLDNRPTYLQKISSLSPPPREIILARFNGQDLQELLLA
jgi:hypothetical protein